MSLADLVPVWAALTAALLAGVCLWAAVRFRVLYSLADPSILLLFQAIFTFWVLLLSDMLPIGDLFGYMLFFTVITGAARWQPSARAKPWITEREWLYFSFVFFWLLLILNAYLIKTKGLLLTSNDLAQSRLDFYEGWGIFKRLNEFGVGIIGIGGIQLWKRGRKRPAISFLLFTAYLSLSLGSRAGLLTFLFIYGAYARFAVQRARNLTLLMSGSVLGLSSLGIFYLMFGNGFLLQFALRLLGYCDGPVYFFFCHLAGKIYYGPAYIFDTFAQAARLRAAPSYLSLGQVLDWNFLHYDNPLTGPNPQFCVEAHVLFGWAYWLWYGLVGLIFVEARKHTSSAYSFFIACIVVGPLLIDSQLAGSELFSAILVGALLIVALGLRRTVILATAQVRLQTAVARG